ncbi:MAG TPA: endonuclease domain-containing protein [Actinomycetes bacterium]|jgi:hypothetical protein|nr:endonuclease domain-containing protein [Actinomycetes bacterium]
MSGVQAVSAQHHPYGVGSAKRHAERSGAVCPNQRPSWWLPAAHHCALDHELRRYPGITCHDYWRLYHLQGGRCAVCGGPPGRWRFAVDRDHDTNAVDGLTHHRCNRAVTQQIRRYLADPPGRALGLAADPAAVARRERRQRRT